MQKFVNGYPISENDLKKVGKWGACHNCGKMHRHECHPFTDLCPECVNAFLKEDTERLMSKMNEGIGMLINFFKVVPVIFPSLVEQLRQNTNGQHPTDAEQDI